VFKLLKYAIAIIFIFSIFPSCSLKKRSYRKGYYIDWTFQSKNKNSEKYKSKKERLLRNNSPIQNPVPVEEVFVAEAGSSIPEIITRKKNNFLSDTVCNDLITLKKGSQYFKARVIEVNETHVKYKRCDNLNGPVFVVHKNDVYSIKYKNGLTEHFERIEEAATLSSQPKQVHPDVELAVVMLISTVIISAVGLILALVFAARAKKRILAEPNKYTGLETVRVVQIIAGVLLALLILLTVFVMAVLLTI
jgi:hypothetical protein